MLNPMQNKKAPDFSEALFLLMWALLDSNQ